MSILVPFFLREVPILCYLVMDEFIEIFELQGSHSTLVFHELLLK